MAGETIMVVEDDIISAEALRENLAGLGYTVLGLVDSGEDAIKIAMKYSPNLVLMDIKLSGPMDGIEAAAAIHKHLDVPVIYLTAYTDDQVLERARITAPYSYLVKPVRDLELKITIEMALYRHRMETRLKERERWLNTVLRSIGDAVLTTDDKGKITFMNPIAEDLSGWSLTEAEGRSFDEILHLVNEETGRAAKNPVSQVLKSCKIVGLANHTVLVAKDGTRRAIDDSAAPIMDEFGRLIGVVMVFRDVSRRREMAKTLEHHRQHLEDLVAERTENLMAEINERKKTESHLRQETEFRSTIINNIAEGLCVWEAIADWPYIRFSLWNGRMIEITGYTIDEINEKGWYECVIPQPEKREQFRKRSEGILFGQPQKSDEVEITCADGKTRTILLSTSLLEGQTDRPQVLWLMRDITHRKQAEQERDRLSSQLRQAQKMEAIGTLAGGIAHDFNNILGSIIGYGELIELFELPDNNEIQENLNHVLNSAYRAKDLVDQILAFSRKSEVERQPVLLAPLIKETLKFLRASLPSTIEINSNIQGLPGAIQADPTQMHQVIMNLCTNAAQAMGDQGGILKINLCAEYLDDDAASQFPDLSPGTYAKLSISDTGAGIGMEIRDRIFEPYFSTKEAGEGTGLGLAVTHGIVQQHNGAIDFESGPDGTTFHVMLPLETRMQAESVNGIEGNSDYPTGKGRILLVDDEADLVRVGKIALGELGYRVDTEVDSTKALKRFGDEPNSYDLVITDQTMPRITGLELAQKIRAIRTDLPIILCTGFSVMVTPDRLTDAGIDLVIRKPIRIGQLADAVHQLLKR